MYASYPACTDIRDFNAEIMIMDLVWLGRAAGVVLEGVANAEPRRTRRERLLWQSLSSLA